MKSFIFKILGIKLRPEPLLYLNHLAELLKENVVVAWDDNPMLKNSTYKQDQLQKELDNGENLGYYQFEDNNKEIEKVTANFQGFGVTYKPNEGEYYLGLHLGTRDSFRWAIHENLEKNFSNVTVCNGNYIKGFKFKDKSIKEIVNTVD